MDTLKPAEQTTPTILVPRKISDLKDFVTTEEDLFVLAHFGFPEIVLADWRLTIGGLVERPLTFSFEDLIKLPSVKVTAFHKCAGSPLNPNNPTPDRVGNVVWSGVPLASILREAKPLPEAMYVWSSGLDHGSFQDVQIDRYTKDLLLSKAFGPEVLLAHQMNGEPLSVARGGPVRLVIPGYYGTNSVKWLSTIELAKTRAPGPFTTIWYNDPVIAEDGRQTNAPVWGIAPDSAFASPQSGRQFSRAEDITARGWAWGEEEIVAVDVSLDAGRTWLQAEIQPRLDRSWQAFRILLPVIEPGTYRLVSRATDRLHRRQPLDTGRNAAVPVEIAVNE